MIDFDGKVRTRLLRSTHTNVQNTKMYNERQRSIEDQLE